MFESDAERLAMLRALGGVMIQGPIGQFTGIVDQSYVAVGDVPVSSSSPQIIARTCDLPVAGVAVGSVLAANGETYLVRALRPDGSGMTDLELELP
jgi:hypothetical protein